LVFGKIEYLNLLPFHVFMKRFIKHSRLKQSMNYYQGVPSNINQKFLTKKVDAAFISSIKSKKCKSPKLGIIAKKDVKSVLVIPNHKKKKDIESATSNVLAEILQINGEIIIGDKALKYALKNDNYIDLARQWHKKYNLPFVFATLCFNKKYKIFKSIEKNFGSKKYKIPSYLLKKASQKSQVSQKEILNYLNLISYKIDKKAQKSIKRFLKLAKDTKSTIL